MKATHTEILKHILHVPYYITYLLQLRYLNIYQPCTQHGFRYPRRENPKIKVWNEISNNKERGMKGRIKVKSRASQTSGY